MMNGGLSTNSAEIELTDSTATLPAPLTASELAAYDVDITNDMNPATSSRTNGHNMALLMYFSYTTLSTTGFGDFNPRSDLERLLCIMILLLGVSIFGLIMNKFL